MGISFPKMRVLVVLLPTALCTSTVLQGQVQPNVTGAANYYYVSKPGELTMEVNIWGAVRTPGRYEISASADLVQLVSYAGGPTPDASLTDVLVTRVYGTEQGSSARRQFTVDLKDLSSTDSRLLVLRPGDTVFFDTRSWVTAREITTVVLGGIATIALVVTAYAQLKIANQ